VEHPNRQYRDRPWNGSDAGNASPAILGGGFARDSDRDPEHRHGVQSGLEVMCAEVERQRKRLLAAREDLRPSRPDSRDLPARAAPVGRLL